MLNVLGIGDMLAIRRLDRLGRDLRHLVNTVHDLMQRGIGFEVLTGPRAAIDMITPSKPASRQR